MAESACFEPTQQQHFCSEASLAAHLYCLDAQQPRILSIDCQRCGETVIRTINGVRIHEALTSLGIVEEVIEWPQSG